MRADEKTGRISGRFIWEEWLARERLSRRGSAPKGWRLRGGSVKKRLGCEVGGSPKLHAWGSKEVWSDDIVNILARQKGSFGWLCLLLRVEQMQDYSEGDAG